MKLIFQNLKLIFDTPIVPFLSKPPMFLSVLFSLLPYDVDDTLRLALALPMFYPPFKFS